MAAAAPPLPNINNFINGNLLIHKWECRRRRRQRWGASLQNLQIHEGHLQKRHEVCLIIRFVGAFALLGLVGVGAAV